VFSGFLRMFRELPNIDAILLNPSGEPVPDLPAALYAVASAFAHRAHRVSRAECARCHSPRSEDQVHRRLQQVGH